MTGMLWVPGICTLLIVVVTALPLSSHPHWLFRGMAFPRLQIAVLAAVLLVAHAVFLDFSLSISWLLVSATALCFLWQVWWVLPYTVLWPREVQADMGGSPDRQLSIITANVLKTNRNCDALIALVHKHQPDVLVTMESDQWWEDSLRDLEGSMPHTVKCPLDNFYGMHVYSRLPLCEEETSFLVEKDVPSMHVCLELRTGDKVRVHFAHPAPPSPTENEESTERDAELIIIAKSIAESTQPVVITGDLNDVAWSSTTRLFRKISGLLDPRIGRGMFNTFHAGYFFLRWPLDHIYHSSHFTLDDLQRLPSIGSDHFAVFVRLVFNPVPTEQLVKPDATQADQEKAQQVSDEMNVGKKDVPKPNEQVT